MLRSWLSRIVAAGLAVCPAFTLWQASELERDVRTSSPRAAASSAAASFALLLAADRRWAPARDGPRAGPKAEDDSSGAIGILAVALGGAAVPVLRLLPPTPQFAVLGAIVGGVAGLLAALTVRERREP